MHDNEISFNSALVPVVSARFPKADFGTLYFHYKQVVYMYCELGLLKFSELQLQDIQIMSRKIAVVIILYRSAISTLG